MQILNALIGVGLALFSSLFAAECKVPFYVNHPYSYMSFWRTPFCFKAATPWLNIIQADDSSDPSLVQIDYLRLYGKIHGRDSLISSNEYKAGTYGGQICMKNPWFGWPWESISVAPQNGLLVVEPSKRPDRVYHFWLERWPNYREDVSKFDSLWFDVRAKITGPALIQAGIDYYEALNYPAGEAPEEGGATDWICTTNEWFTLKLERSTEVIRKSVPAEKYNLGQTVNTSFTLKNCDNQTVHLTQLGVEIRKIGTPDGCFYWKTNPQTISGFAWLNQNIVLAPGDSINYASSWTPTQSGDYYLTVIEKRSANPNYQRPYSRTIDVIHVVEPNSIERVTPQEESAAVTFSVFPSPFNSRLILEVELVRNMPIQLAIFDVTGKIVTLLVDKEFSQGKYTFHWTPAALPSGLYFAQLTTSDEKQVKSVLYIR